MGSCYSSASSGRSLAAPRTLGTIVSSKFSHITITDLGVPHQWSPSSVNRRIDMQIARDKKKLDNTVKLLLLGPAESGKTTLLKQIKIIHQNGYTSAELMSFTSVIHHNVLQSMMQLLIGIRMLGLPLPPEYEDLADAVREEAKLLNFERLSGNMYYYIRIIWRCPVIQEAYERRSEFQLMDCAKHFLDDIDRLCSPDYCPTEVDVLNARTPTTGVHESHYPYNGRELRIIDVGGQRSERRKWITVFDNVNAVIFFAAISEYDQVMAEDYETNRLKDALRLFHEIGTNALFDRAHMVVFLNKKDLFEEKIKKVPLKKCFPNYKFKNNYATATSYIIRKFEKYHHQNKKNIYTHLTCAMDRDQMQFLTKSVADMLMNNMIKTTGILR